MPFFIAMSDTPAQPGLNGLSKSFEPAALEAHWGPEWERRGYGQAGVRGTGAPDASAPAFAIQLPPPNVTGTLHMGHAFNQTIMDSLTRYHRMLGHNTAWVPGTDHAGIATQIVVERQLQEQGISRHDLGRPDFVKKVWEWKEKSGNTITTQMRRLGDTVDWSREYFTMDDKLSKVVTETFVKLYEQGLIYRGKRLVNWDPKLQSAVSDLEVESVEAQGKMHYITYPFADGPQLIDGVMQRGMTIATTRPETMMADGALAVHPEDERYKHLVGKLVELPLMGRNIPVIADDFVDREFGSGCVKITGAHDFNDYACAQRHGLPLITIFTLDAHVNENGPAAYQGMDRFAARKAVVADLEAGGYLVEIKAHKLMLPTCTRTGQVVEPMLTDQWFIAMNKVGEGDATGKSIAQKAIDAVASGQVSFVPENWVNTYNQWMNNIQDWCISRQLWWGHQIPAWYEEDGKVYVAKSEADAQAQAPGKTLKRDEDAAVARVPGRDLVAPPELAADAPVLDVVHPVVVGVDPLLGHEAHLAAGHRVDRLGGDALAVATRLGHGDEPLLREHRLDDLAGAFAARHDQAVLLRLDQQAERVQVGDDALARLEAIQAAVGGGCVVVDRRVEREHAEHRQTVALADCMVVGVVRRRHLDDAGAELAVDVGVGDHRDRALGERQPHAPADEGAVAFVVGMHHHRGVAEHGLGARRGHDQRAAAVLERIADQPQEAVFLLARHLEVGDGALQLRVPAHHALAAVDQALVVQPHEGLGDDGRELRVHREVLAAPVHAGAQAPHLVADGGARAVLPLPDLGDEGLAAQVLATRTLLLQLPLDDDLGGDARVVGARHPQRVEAAHAVVARERVHDRLVERVPHVQRAGDVGRRQLDRERCALGVERGGVQAAALPVRRPAGLDGGGVERLGELGHGKMQRRRDAIAAVNAIDAWGVCGL